MRTNFYALAACALAVSGFLAGGAQAMSLRELRSLQATESQGDLYARYYLVGAMEGLLEAQALAARSGRQPVVCLKDRKLEPQMANELFATELRRHADVYEADMPATLVLLNALKTVYPCN